MPGSLWPRSSLGVPELVDVALPHLRDVVEQLRLPVVRRALGEQIEALVGGPYCFTSGRTSRMNCQFSSNNDGSYATSV